MTKLTAKVADEFAGRRLDQVLADIFPEYSRSRLQRWIKTKRVLVNGVWIKPKHRLQGGEMIALDAEPETAHFCEPERIPLDIVYEDPDIVIVNKPAGMVVHPAAGNWCGTLQNALLYFDPALAALPRAGLVHRIDKDTSGLLMVARTLQAHNHLVTQLQAREINRYYWAVVQGTIIAGGTVDQPIGRHPVDRKRNVVAEGGKPAVTHYRVVERFTRHTLIEVKLETGRTHQIRVHMESIHYPLLGDPVYSRRFRMPPACNKDLQQVLRSFRRQALHAAKLGLIHPKSGAYMEWEAPMPTDMQHLLSALRENDRELAGS